MRTINIKNIRHTYIHHVLAALLLLSFVVLSKNQPTKLLNLAEQQQQKLVEKFGLLENQKWLKRCDQLMTTLSLSEFNQCFIIDADFANAYSLANGVLILTKGLMQNIKNDDQLAHIMSHEHAHLVLNHHHQAMQMVNNPPTFFTKSRLKKFYRQLESAADQAATERMLELKRDPLQIHHYLLRIEKNSKEDSSDHQKIKDRIQRNDLPDEVLETFWLSQ